jgi:hypothetical protein
MPGDISVGHKLGEGQVEGRYQGGWQGTNEAQDTSHSKDFPTQSGNSEEVEKS